MKRSIFLLSIAILFSLHPFAQETIEVKTVHEALSDIDAKVDDFEGYTDFRSSKTPAKPDDKDRLFITLIQKKDGNLHFNFWICHNPDFNRSGEYMFFEKISVRTDTATYTINCNDKNTFADGTLHSYFRTPFTTNQKTFVWVQDMMNCKTLKVRLNGHGKQLEWEVSNREKKAIKDVLTLYNAIINTRTNINNSQPQPNSRSTDDRKPSQEIKETNIPTANTTEKITPQPKHSDQYIKAVNYGSIAFRFYQDNDIDHCIEYSKKALLLENSLMWVKLNLGICYLLKGDQSTANDYYIDAISDADKADKTDAKRYLQRAIADIDKVQANKPLQGASIIRPMLQDKLDQLK